MKIILSIYGHHHDSSISILNGNKILLNLELERVSRIKHDSGVSINFIKKCLNHAKIRKIDFLSTDIETLQILKKKKILSKIDLKNNKLTNAEISKYKIISGQCFFFGRKCNLVLVHHHLAHAAGSYYTSPFKNCAVLTADAGGNLKNFSLSYFKNGKLISYDHQLKPSLGYLWALLPRAYGITEPGSLMAISAYYKNKEKKLIERIKKIFLENIVQTFSINKLYRKLFLQLGFKIDSKLSISNPLKVDENNASLAFALQDLTDDIFSKWFGDIYKKSRAKNLCFGGGLALNCIGNTRAVNNSGITTIHVPPNPNDSGLSLGAGLATFYIHLKNEFKGLKCFSPYTGPEYTDDDIKELLNLYLKKGFKLKVRNTNNDLLATLLEKGNIIARFYGRSECGPRALGHRSFIARPDKKNLRQIMNKIKCREWYRPFAPMVLKKYAKDMFVDSINNSYYMNTSAKVNQNWISKLQGVIHEDYTTRPQFVDRMCCKDTYDLLNKFYKKSNIPALLNTSFNVKSPLVETPDDALKTFIKINNVNYLQLNKFLISK